MLKFINLWDDNQTIFIKTKEGMKYVKDGTDEFTWHFFIDYDDAKKHQAELIEKRELKKFKMEFEGDYVNIIVPYLERELILARFKELGIKTYEADLKLFQRYLVDEDVELETDQRILYFDIETDDRGHGISPGRDAILSIAAIGSDGEEYYFSYREEDKYGEVKMLRKFLKVLDEYDIVAGWHSEGFDLVALAIRINGKQKRDEDGELMRDEYNHKIWEIEGLNLHLKKKIEFKCGVIEQTAKDLGGLDSVRRLGKLKAKPYQFNHLDLMQKFKTMHYRDTELIKKVRSFSLSSVSKVILNEDKIDLGGKGTYALWKDDPEFLKRYNMQDVRLLVKLDKALNISMQTLVEHHVCCARINDYTSHGKIDVFALRGAKGMGKHLPTKPGDPGKKKRKDGADLPKGNVEADYEGGFVFEPKTGLHENVYAFDYSSLYPSIIKTFNVSIDSFKGVTKWTEGMEFPKNRIVMPTGAMFDRKNKGIIPTIIQFVLDSRNQIRHVDMPKMVKGSLEYQNAHYRQYAFKVLANSIYGIMGASFSRYFKRELAEGITLTGQHLIKLSAKWFEDRGFEVIYGDSDSLYLKKDGGVDEDKLSGELKIFIEQSIRKSFNIKDCYLEMTPEGKFTKFLSADKKKYAGVKGDGEMKVIGLETKKRDTLPKASEWQKDLLEKLLKEDHDEKYYKEWVESKRKMIDTLTVDEITYQKRLSKEIEDYGKPNKNGRPQPIPVHVKVAKWVKENLEKIGQQDDKINMYSQGAYVPWIVINSKDGIEGIHPLLFDGHYDKVYYWQKCYDPSKRILQVVFKQTDWDDEHLRSFADLEDMKRQVDERRAAEKQKKIDEKLERSRQRIEKRSAKGREKLERAAKRAEVKRLKSEDSKKERRKKRKNKPKFIQLSLF